MGMLSDYVRRSDTGGSGATHVCKRGNEVKENGSEPVSSEER